MDGWFIGLLVFIALCGLVGLLHELGSIGKTLARIASELADGRQKQSEKLDEINYAVKGIAKIAEIYHQQNMAALEEFRRR